MSHLRAKVQQTSGQTLNTSHHFPAQFQNSLARQAGTGGRSSNVQKLFQSCLRACPTLLSACLACFSSRNK